MKNMVLILFLFALLSSTCSHASNVNDYCVADLRRPDGPSGYHCKPTENVTVDDFVFTRFLPGNTSNLYKISATMAFVQDYPGVNGLGISAARIDMDKGGIVPMHTHPGGSELIMIVQGEMTVGFITDSKVYEKTLKPGNTMVIPQGQLHYNINSGPGKATAFSAYSSANPRVHLLNMELFGNNLTTPRVEKITFINALEVKRLKALFGGSG